MEWKYANVKNPFNAKIGGWWLCRKFLKKKLTEYNDEFGINGMNLANEDLGQVLIKKKRNKMNVVTII